MHGRIINLYGQYAPGPYKEGPKSTFDSEYQRQKWFEQGLVAIATKNTTKCTILSRTAGIKKTSFSYLMGGAEMPKLFVKCKETVIC